MVRCAICGSTLGPLHWFRQSLEMLKTVGYKLKVQGEYAHKRCIDKAEEETLKT